MEIGKILAISVGAVWLTIIIIYLIIKDVKDRKYNKVLMTKEQMLEKEERKENMF